MRSQSFPKRGLKTCPPPHEKPRERQNFSQASSSDPCPAVLWPLGLGLESSSPQNKQMAAPLCMLTSNPVQLSSMYKIKFSLEVHIFLYSQPRPPPPPLMKFCNRFQAREGIQGEKGEKGREKGGREEKKEGWEEKTE